MKILGWIIYGIVSSTAVYALFPQSALGLLMPLILIVISFLLGSLDHITSANFRGKNRTI